MEEALAEVVEVEVEVPVGTELVATLVEEVVTTVVVVGTVEVVTGVVVKE